MRLPEKGTLPSIFDETKYLSYNLINSF
jgi:hypothetical protein